MYLVFEPAHISNVDLKAKLQVLCNQNKHVHVTHIVYGLLLSQCVTFKFS